MRAPAERRGASAAVSAAGSGASFGTDTGGENSARTGAAGTTAFAELPHRYADARRVVDDAAGVGADIDVLVVLGIGGSALGARALVSALGERPGGRRVIVADSIDPDDFGALLGQLDA